ncbi:MAG TPA: hypothetical protein VFV80_14495, partial [Geminicoccaceae bacterium]|nr:hypothetical protein [Geminicoccaceae bacterium]
MKHTGREDPTRSAEPDDEAGEAQAPTGVAAEASPEEPEPQVAGRLAELEAELADTKDRVLRALADNEN